MTTRATAPGAALPDIDDATFRARLAPLEQTILHRKAGAPDDRSSDTSENRNSGDPVSAAQQIQNLKATRGSRKGVEFLLPQRVVAALRAEAAREGLSMSARLLQILRAAGLPVIDEDFVDIRRLPRR
jgi:hypothetical protein